MEYEDEESLKAYFLDIKDNYVKEIELMMDLRGVSNIVFIEDFLVEEKDEIKWNSQTVVFAAVWPFFVSGPFGNG